MQLTILGSGNAAGVPVYGCNCPACARARQDSAYRRRACSAFLETETDNLLLDAGLPDLDERFPAGTLQAILLTHYHMDHVQGLFRLRWGVHEPIPVISPNDAKGADDLYKHPGIFDFTHRAQAFVPLQIGGFSITPIKLYHSRPALGYYLRYGERSIAYLTDTVGLPEVSCEFLAAQEIDLLVIDASEPPRQTPPRNHNDLDLALAIHTLIRPHQTLLTHIGHELDNYLQEHPHALPADVRPAYDGLTIEL
ncbi:phosphonate metabolism protein PhnP [Alkalilimnicola ehrlichii]|uniref:Phosphonate metabolism protein PhnP n=1 Tax=Alkalilimnicola ehrlichii TaxID=351052 RepID=A0A3E0X0X6_9GAMM|nr:phosphonate metabolism protein PhnP [Alkalilimnicola ehrlichii]RFA30373.1 phosphonate metabolism protein PhnP [Alkalilimnicola ehrlichii]RFA37946.1 phosphonate metabolism protein PhnP [Alkalilimnicola ehrlichii]